MGCLCIWKLWRFDVRHMSSFCIKRNLSWSKENYVTAKRICYLSWDCMQIHIICVKWEIVGWSEIWNLKCETWGWNAWCEVWNVNCEVWKLMGILHVRCEMWNVDCEVWNVKCEIWTCVKCKVWNVKYDMWSVT